MHFVYLSNQTMMKSEHTFGLESESQTTGLFKGRSKSKIKFVRIGRQSTLSDLANIELGTYIKSDSGLNVVKVYETLGVKPQCGMCLCDAQTICDSEKQPV